MTIFQPKPSKSTGASFEVQAALEVAAQLKNNKKRKKKKKEKNTEETRELDEFESRYSLSKYDEEEEDSTCTLFEKCKVYN